MCYLTQGEEVKKASRKVVKILSLAGCQHVTCMRPIREKKIHEWMFRIEAGLPTRDNIVQNVPAAAVKAEKDEGIQIHT